MFEHLAVYDWNSFGALLSADVERIGPAGEQLVGRDAYVELMAGTQRASGGDPPRTTWDVHCVAYSGNERSAFARITAHVPLSGRDDLRIEQTLTYEFDEDGLISRMEVFLRQPPS
jgi:hypothetical protein